MLGIIIVNIILVLLSVAAFNNYTHFKNAAVVEESIEESMNEEDGYLLSPVK